MERGSAREAIIERGASLIHAQGFKSTGLQQILDAAGVPKGSFYFYFKSKEDFGLAVIDHFDAATGDVFRRFLGDIETPPLARLENLFKYYEVTFQKTGNTRGCPIGNLSLELADASERLRTHLEAVVSRLIAAIEGCLEEAAQNNSLPEGLDTADTSRFIFHAFEGAVLHMKVTKNIEPYRTFRRYVSEYLKKGNSQSINANCHHRPGTGPVSPDNLRPGD